MPSAAESRVARNSEARFPAPARAVLGTAVQHGEHENSVPIARVHPCDASIHRHQHTICSQHAGVVNASCKNWPWARRRRWSQVAAGSLSRACLPCRCLAVQPTAPPPCSPAGCTGSFRPRAKRPPAAIQPGVRRRKRLTLAPYRNRGLARSKKPAVPLARRQVIECIARQRSRLRTASYQFGHLLQVSTGASSLGTRVS